MMQFDMHCSSNILDTHVGVHCDSEHINSIRSRQFLKLRLLTGVEVPKRKN